MDPVGIDLYEHEESTKNFIIYGLVDPITNEMKYVGQSRRGLTRPKSHLEPKATKRKSHLANWLKSLGPEKPKIVILEYVLSGDLDDLNTSERGWISYFKTIGCRLTNLTEGGDGLPNPSLEVREKMRQSHLGKGKWSAERRKAFSEHMKKIAPMRRPEVAIKNAAAKRGRKRPDMAGDNALWKRPDVRKKMVASNAKRIEKLKKLWALKMELPWIP